MPILSARGIAKSYGAVTALHDVDFVVHAGEIVALAGENGSGKSTLSRILAGVAAADRGQIYLDGALHRFPTPRSALDAGIALVSQEPMSVPDLSVAENVMLPFLRRPASVFRRRAIQAAAAEFIHRVGLDIDPGRPLASLRGGERELIEVAKALATRPRVLILDEATARLPAPEHLFDVVRELRAAGVSTIFISHRLRETELLADRAVVLRDGRVTGELIPPEITSERLSAMMVGRELEQFFGHRRRPRDTAALRVSGLVVEGSTTPVDLTVRHGEVVGLSGLIGAGRTELLETIVGVRPYRHGSVCVDGKAVRAGSVRAAIEAGIVLVPEDRVAQGLVAGASVRENIMMGSHRALSFVRRKDERGRVEGMISTLAIRTESTEAPAATLSGGNQQKLVLARNLLQQPQVLLLDEPTRGLAIGAKADFYDVINSLVARGVAVLVGSSEMIELLGFCDRIVVMHQRAVVGDLGREEATEERLALLSGGG